MSHEIRTPITAVLGISEVQLRNKVMPAHTEEAFAKIYDSSKTLLSIVNDILDFSKIESGKMPLFNNEYDVASLVSDAGHLHTVYLDKKDISFQMNVDKNLPAMLVGDALRIKQIMNNLLTNAFKYTESGSVILAMKCEEGQKDDLTLVITVEDTGLGMTAAQIRGIKDPDNEFVRLHEQEKPLVSGTGRGLSIAYNLAQMMDADIDWESQPGKGTCATVRIPQKRASDQVIGEELAERLQSFKWGTWSSAKNFEFKPEPMPYGKVLVVDDVEINLYVVESMLELYDLDIKLCKSGLDAIEKIREGNEYDIIFMDHMMPGIDGMETTKIIREMGYKHPIVALTANALKGQEEVYMSNGFTGFMS